MEVFGGMVAGILLGFFLQYFPSKDQVRKLATLMKTENLLNLGIKTHVVWSYVTLMYVSCVTD